MLPFSGISKVP